MNAEELQGPQSGGEDTPRPITVSFTKDECQVLLMALGELLGSVQRQEHLVPTIDTLTKRLKDAQPTSSDGRSSTLA
jgi:hypothetical protein